MTPAEPSTPHVTLITLGVRDLQRALAFYQTLGWQAHPRSDDKSYFSDAGHRFGSVRLK